MQKEWPLVIAAVFILLLFLLAAVDLGRGQNFSTYHVRLEDDGAYTSTESLAGRLMRRIRGRTADPENICDIGHMLPAQATSLADAKTALEVLDDWSIVQITAIDKNQIEVAPGPLNKGFMSIVRKFFSNKEWYSCRPPLIDFYRLALSGILTIFSLIYVVIDSRKNRRRSE